MSESYCYVISDGEYLKVWVARHPMKRLRQLQTGNVRKLELIGFFSGGFEIESEIHKKFLVRRGEWMKATDQLIEFLNEKIQNKLIVVNAGKIKAYMKIGI